MCFPIPSHHIQRRPRTGIPPDPGILAPSLYDQIAANGSSVEFVHLLYSKLLLI
jgi:hypothetical protein